MERLQEIAQALGWPVEAFETRVRPVVIRFAGLVQQLPAVMDSLSDTTDTLALDNGLQAVLEVLTTHRPPSQETPPADISTVDVQYALITAVLLKCAERVITRQSVTLFDRQGHPLGMWNPLTGPMGEVAHAVYYRPALIHRKPLPGLSLGLAPDLIPADELFKLFQQETLNECWRRVLIEDEPIDTLGALLRAAASESTEAITLDESQEKDMLTIESIRAASSMPDPSSLREALLIGLRALLATDRESSLNTPDGFSWRVGEHLYLVGKIMAQRLREQPALEPYQTLIQHNVSLYQLLVDQGVAIPAPDKPIFNVRITEGTWDTEAAVLKFPLSWLWPEESDWPASFTGTVSEKNPRA
jgi:hypothetical protein